MQSISHRTEVKHCSSFCSLIVNPKLKLTAKNRQKLTAHGLKNPVFAEYGSESYKNTRGVSYKNTRGVSYKNTRGVSYKNTRGVSCNNTRGVSCQILEVLNVHQR